MLLLHVLLLLLRDMHMMLRHALLPPLNTHSQVDPDGRHLQPQMTTRRPAKVSCRRTASQCQLFSRLAL